MSVEGTLLDMRTYSDMFLLRSFRDDYVTKTVFCFGAVCSGFFFSFLETQNIKNMLRVKFDISFLLLCT